MCNRLHNKFLFFFWKTLQNTNEFTAFFSFLIVWRRGQQAAQVVKLPSQPSILLFIAWMQSISYLASLWCFMFFLTTMVETAWSLPPRFGCICVLEFLRCFIPQNGFQTPRGLFSGCWVILLHFASRSNCIPHWYVVYVNHFTSLLSTVVRSWACSLLQHV